MTAILTFAHQKGGVGKSTLSINTAGFFERIGQRVALVDIDPQGSVAKLVDAYAGQPGRDLPIIRRGEFSDLPDLLERLRGFDLAIIDTPPYLSPELGAIMAVSDLVIVPVKPSPLDLMASLDTLALIEAEASGAQVVVVLTMVPATAGQTDNIRKQLELNGYQVLKTEIGNRVSYSRSLLASYLVQGDKKALAEVFSLCQEVFQILTKEA